MIRRPPRSTQSRSSAASDVYKRQVHVCSQKELFNSLIVKEEGTVKIVDGSACKIISTGTVKVTERDETVHALEAVLYIPEARYNLISIRVLDEEGFWIQVQQGVVTVSQGGSNLERREVRRVKQAKGRKLSSRWSFRDKLEREFIARWSFKEDCNET